MEPVVRLGGDEHHEPHHRGERHVPAHVDLVADQGDLSACATNSEKGQRVISTPGEVRGAVMDILAESKVVAPGANRNFLIELNVESTRHNEIQLIGNGKWSFLALWGSVTWRGGTEEQARAFVAGVYSRVPVLDPAARGY